MLAFVTASANELTRTNKITELIEGDDSNSQPWEWDRVGHDTAANLAKDCGSQTLTRFFEIRAKGAIGMSAPYCELLKHAHKAACKEFHTCRALPAGRLAASAKAAKMVPRGRQDVEHFSVVVVFDTFLIFP